MLDTIKARYWSFIPRGERRTKRAGAVADELVVLAAIAKGRDGAWLSDDEPTALFVGDPPGADRGDSRRGRRAARRTRRRDVTFVVNRNINFTNICTVGCAFCGFGQSKRSPDAYEH